MATDRYIVTNSAAPEVFHVVDIQAGPRKPGIVCSFKYRGTAREFAGELNRGTAWIGAVKATT
jgi:hypothetical protein